MLIFGAHWVRSRELGDRRQETPRQETGFRSQETGDSETGDYFFYSPHFPTTPLPHFPTTPLPHFPTPHTPHPTPHFPTALSGTPVRPSPCSHLLGG
ncbi:hypothetical protein [Microcystis aeruginosa]|uniref:hypothetical protein n=1 Tax=Microcystis aeruginosa TaxID=1126 RepID=UPI000B0D0CC4|nr:hypothetical protein [Microcystis aeruginosa]